jgi:hypothetical protein
MGVIVDCRIGFVLVANNAWISVMGMKTTNIDDKTIDLNLNNKKNKRTNITT